METKNETKTAPTSAQSLPMGGVPEWVMHLLTGLGTMGAEYMLFIKPLQEKMELQSQLIKEQGKRIEELEKFLPNKQKPKREVNAQHEDQNEGTDYELFQVKRNTAPINKYAKHARVKL